MLGNDCDEPLQATQDRSVDNDRPRHDTFIGGSILQIEPLGQLEVELDSRTLEGAAQSIADGDVNLGAVEGTVAWVELPFAWIVPVEGLGELLNEGGGNRISMIT